MDPHQAIGKTIVQLRKNQGRDQKQFAKAAKLSVAQLNRIENAQQSRIGLKVLTRIATAFGLKLSEFIFLVEKHLPRRKKSR